jgi:hypothetical protein
MNFGIGKVAKKKGKVGRPKKKVAAARGRKPTAGSKVSSTGKRYFPSTPKGAKEYKVTKSCSVAGSNLKNGIDKSTAGAILALCKASVKANNLAAAALKKYGVRRTSLSRKK